MYSCYLQTVKLQVIFAFFFFCIFQILKFYLFIFVVWVFIAAHRCSLVAAHRLLIAMASLVAEHGLWGAAWVSAVAACGLNSCGTQA